MKIKRQRYQVGNVPRSHGFVWEFPRDSTDPDRIRRLKEPLKNPLIFMGID